MLIGVPIIGKCLSSSFAFFCIVLTSYTLHRLATVMPGKAAIFLPGAHIATYQAAQRSGKKTQMRQAVFKVGILLAGPAG